MTNKGVEIKFCVQLVILIMIQGLAFHFLQENFFVVNKNADTCVTDDSVFFVAIFLFRIFLQIHNKSSPQAWI